MKSKLIGKVNKENIKIRSISCDALLDSGSVISCISKDFYNTYCSDVPICSLENLFQGTLSITSASSDSLNLLGYIEVDVHLPGLSQPMSAALMVMSDSILNESMPALIGSNILETWKDALIHHGGKMPLVVNDKTICASTSHPCNITIPMAMVFSNSSDIANPVTHPMNHYTHKDSHQIPQPPKEEFLKMFKYESCPPEHQASLEDCIWRNRASFAINHHEIGKCSTTKHNIELSDHSPIRQKYRRIPPHLFKAVQDELQKMHEAGIIRPSMSPWSSPVTVAVKSDGSPRICLDLRKVNDLTKKDAKSVPNVQEMFDMLNGKKIFSSLDLFSGFLQIELEEHCKEITAFTCGPLGFWEMNRMPFGACNSSATFQRTMEVVLSDLLYSTSLVYIDDIIVYATSPEEHINNLDKVFRRLHEHGLTLKPSKCTFFSTELKFLGHMITRNGLEKDPSKIQAILDWERPTTVTEVRQFMGLCGFLRKFIHNFATIAAPITDLSRGYRNGRKNNRHNTILEQTNFIWTEAQETAFQTLKTVIAEDVTLSYADFSRPFRLSTDACRTGLGAVLEQQEPDQKWRPIGFASRRTNETERNYPTHKLEFLALKWAITDKFSDYLRTHSFTVFSDNNPLTYILTNNKLDATAQRWVSSLEPYTFTIKYKPGTDNTVADALSRKYEKETTDETTKYQGWAKELCYGFPSAGPPSMSIVTAVLGPHADVKSADYDWEQLQTIDTAIQTVVRLKQLDEKPTKDQRKGSSPQTKILFKHFDNLKIHNNLLYYQDQNNKRKLVVPTAQREKLVKLYHSFGHFGITRTIKLIQARFFWPGIKEIVMFVCNACERCQKAKTPKQANKGPLGHITTPPSPMHTISMDYLSIDTRAQSKFKVLTIIDEFSKYGFALIVKSENAKITAQALYKNIYTKFGIPEVIHTDRGQTFLSNILKQLNMLLSIKHTVTTPYRPQSNGTCERLNSTIISRIRTLHPHEKPKWHMHLDSLLLAYNSTVHESTGTSPFYTMFGRQPKIPLDLMIRIPNMDNELQATGKSFVADRETELKASFELCAKNIAKRKERNKRNYDRKVGKTTLTFNPDDRVLVRKHASKNKIDDRYQAEIFEIVTRKDDTPLYIIKGLERGSIKTIHRDNLILFKQATVPHKPMTLNDIPSWQQLQTKPYVPDEENIVYMVNKHLNSKVAIFYGDPNNIKADSTIVIPKEGTEDQLVQQLKSSRKEKHQQVLLDVNKLANNRNHLRTALHCIRRCVTHKDWIKIVICTTNSNIYNMLNEDMHTYFPKTLITKAPTVYSESDDNSDEEYFIPYHIPDEREVNDNNGISSDESNEEDSNDEDDNDSNESSEEESDESNDESSDDGSSDSYSNGDLNEESDDEQPRYNMRSSGRRPSVRLRDYYTS